jgi:hypothetical protein
MVVVIQLFLMLLIKESIKPPSMVMMETLSTFYLFVKKGREYFSKDLPNLICIDWSKGNFIEIENSIAPKLKLGDNILFKYKNTHMVLCVYNKKRIYEEQDNNNIYQIRAFFKGYKRNLREKIEKTIILE